MARCDHPNLHHPVLGKRLAPREEMQLWLELGEQRAVYLLMCVMCVCVSMHMPQCAAGGWRTAFLNQQCCLVPCKVLEAKLRFGPEHLYLASPGHWPTPVF